MAVASAQVAEQFRFPSARFGGSQRPHGDGGLATIPTWIGTLWGAVQTILEPGLTSVPGRHPSSLFFQGSPMHEPDQDVGYWYLDHAETSSVYKAVDGLDIGEALHRLTAARDRGDHIYRQPTDPEQWAGFETSVVIATFNVLSVLRTASGRELGVLSYLG